MDIDRIKRKLEESLRQNDGFKDDILIQDIIFHLTDWTKDLEELNAFYANPDSIDGKSVVTLLMKFLSHVPDHLAAAKKLVTGIPVTDVFGIDALNE